MLVAGNTFADELGCEKSEGPPTPNPRCACDRWAGATNRFPAQDEAASTKRAARHAGKCTPLA